MWHYEICFRKVGDKMWPCITVKPICGNFSDGAKKKLEWDLLFRA
jgi:hypothetical protein